MPKQKRRSSRFYTYEQWKQFFDDWQKSGLTRHAYCKQHGIGETAFFNWSQKLLDPEASKKAFNLAQEPSSTRYTPEQWQGIIEEWEKSDLSKEAYCRHKNLSCKAFHYWLEKLVKPDSSCKSYSLRKDTPPQYYTTEQWKEIIDDWKKSGLSRDIYCTKKNLARTTFYHWSKKFEDPEFYEQALKFGQTAPHRHYTLEQQKEYVDDWKKSGLPKEAYCREKGLASSTFYNWAQKFKNPEFFEEALKRGQAPVPRRHTLEEQKKYVDDWKKSGLSKEAYCRKNNLSSSTFYYWEQKFSRLQSSSSVSKEFQKKESALSFQDQFIPVILKPASVTAAAPVSSANQKVEVILSQGHRLSLEGLFEWEALTPLLTALLTK